MPSHGVQDGHAPVQADGDGDVGGEVESEHLQPSKEERTEVRVVIKRQWTGGEVESEHLQASKEERTDVRVVIKKANGQVERERANTCSPAMRNAQR